MNIVSYDKDVLFKNINIEALPFNIKEILSKNEIVFFYIMTRNVYPGKISEICLINKTNLTRSILFIKDNFLKITAEVIALNEIKTRQERNEEINRVYYRNGLSQVFLSEFFKISQPSISLITKKGRKNNNE